MKKILLTVLFFTCLLSFSQKHELGKVTIEELKEKVCPNDTSAVAAILFNVGNTSFEYSGEDGFSIVTEIDTKIKIYKKRGYDYANHSEKIYNGGRGTEKVNISKAITYNLNGDKIEKTKLSGEGEFDEKVNKLWGRKKITMPNVKEGSIIEYRITIKSPYIYNFPEWEFQRDIPVVYSEYTTYIPEYHLYNTHFKGFYSPTVTNTSKSRNIKYTYTEKVVPGMGAGMPRRITDDMDFKEVIAKYVLTNIAGLKDESYTNNIDNYKSAIIHELAGTRYPNSTFENYSTNWETVTKNIYTDEKFGDELKKTGYFERDLDVLLNAAATQDERISVIFNFVKSRMNWNEFTSYFCDLGVKKAYQDKKGNSADINLMLVAMLRYANINANPVLVSTRSNGMAIFPSQSAFNYVIAAIELNDRVILLDATNKYALPDILPIRDLNWFGRIIRKNDSSDRIDLMPKSNSKDIINIMGTINEQGEISGKIRDQYFDYNAFIFRNRFNGVSKESYIEKLEKEHQGIEINDYDVQNNNDLSKPIVENYSFMSGNSVEIIGDKMYFSPFLFFAKTENPFKQESREYPVDFVFPQQDKFNISIKIPDGYTVETMPQPLALAMPENLGSFKYSISNNGNQIQLLYTQDINQAIIGAEDYEALKQFYREIVNKQTEKIVLKKV